MAIWSPLVEDRAQSHLVEPETESIILSKLSDLCAPGDNLPILLSAIGIGLIIISGWLGGELVYVRGVAVKQPPDESV